MEENPYRPPKPVEQPKRPEQSGCPESRRDTLFWCGALYIVGGFITLGIMAAPDLGNKHWAVYPVIGGLAAWWFAAGYSLMNLSKATYFLALPLALIMVIGFPIGPILSGVVGYCLFKEAKSVFGKQFPN